MALTSRAFGVVGNQTIKIAASVAAKRNLPRSRPLLTRHEFARFGKIATRNVSEGWFYVACDVFPRASLADASGYGECVPC
jgi:hypothetical protein